MDGGGTWEQIMPPPASTPLLTTPPRDDVYIKIIQEMNFYILQPCGDNMTAFGSLWEMNKGECMDRESNKGILQQRPNIRRRVTSSK